MFVVLGSFKILTQRRRVLVGLPGRSLISSMIYITILFIVVLCRFTLSDQRAITDPELGLEEKKFTNRPTARYRGGQENEKLVKRSVYFAMNVNANDSISNNYNNYNSVYQNDQPQVLTHCCACDEAKYELVFEGLWSRYTHPDDFPENYWSAHFSDIIGASHSTEFRMWNHDSFATEGVKELAEVGSTKKLESELKQVSSKTRTIIKARELRYPTLNSKTSAVFRTDRQHHLVSILSKLAPSPDWIVGVSGLELCQADCSWAAQRIVNLYLWDAGTDSGTSFTSPDIPTRPQERIHPFRKAVVNGQTLNLVNSSSSFDQSTSQFQTTRAGFDLSTNSNYNQNQNQNQRRNYDQAFETNSDTLNDTISSSSPPTNSLDQSKPFARLTITRQRIYEKSCNGDTSIPIAGQSGFHHSSAPIPESWPEPTKASYVDCRFTGWSDWSSCSSTCGRGIRTRTRAFIDEQAQLSGCSQVDLIEKEVCLSECIGNYTCVTRDWSEWSRCSVSCGNGYRKRTRSPIGPMTRQCESIEYAQHEPCTVGSVNDCPNEPSQCDVSEWSQWSDCSVACGKGTRIRTRQYTKKDNIENCSAKLIQKQSCTGRPELCKQSSTGSTQPHAQINPNLPVIDCKLSAWSPWSTCSALCGFGRRTRSRYIIQMPQNGGKACDKKLSRTQRCKDLPPCPPTNYPTDKGLHHNTRISTNNHKMNINRHQGGSSQKNNDWRTSSTTVGSSMMDDEDDSKFSRLLQADYGHLQPGSFASNVSFIRRQDETISNTTELIVADEPKQRFKPCEYGNWTQWSDCEVVCQPVKKGSNKVRQRVPINYELGDKCQILEELYYCDPNIYC